ncbi:hypothetical protein C8R44DRAFT_770513 [Mycena epipterygia]|nr:hypothetical protein C8R44DRAFT_770513 [Mycena epipterygia]
MPLSQLDLSLGALEVGVLLSSTLWGVTTVQFYVYLTTPINKNDPYWTRIPVYVVWILESLHTIFAWIYLYRLTVTFYGIPAALNEAHWSLDTSSLFDGIIGAIVQMFFAYRIRMFSDSWPVTLVAWLGSLLQLACTIGVTILSGQVSVAEFGARYGWIVEALLIINFIVDTINTSALTYYLQRGRTGFKATDLVVEKLVMWTIETGLITAVAAAVQLILFKALPTSALWIGISLFYAKLYSNSFLAILNSRSVLRLDLNTDSHDQTTDLSFHTLSGLNHNTNAWNNTETDGHGTIVHVHGQDDPIELATVKQRTTIESMNARSMSDDRSI